ncbi:MAG: chemotaxis protein CheC [Clostridia bacterium]|nr:chemotaxis protein CheC [Clostridia bacterium]NCC43398.1 chemotaxis protein CheC [Clostridia bacterium]
MVNDYSDLNEEHKDILLELGNIGTGNALTALSQLTDYPIKMDLPTIKIVDIQHLTETLDEGNEEHVGVAIKVGGSLECMVTFMLNEHFAKIMVKELTGEELNDIHEMSEMQESSICELGNIMCNAYLNALASMLALDMDVSVPSLEIGRSREIFDVFSKEYKDELQEVLFIKNTFSYSAQEVVSHILLQPKFESLREILGRLEG